MTAMRLVSAATSLLTLFLGVPHLSAQNATDDTEFFEKKIRPVLIEHCYECHGDKKQKGGLRLDFRQGWQKGGDSGVALIPHKPNASLIIKAVEYKDRDFEMPPDGKLPANVIQDFRKWVAAGAPDPRDNPALIHETEESISLEEGRKFWSFKPVKKPDIPKPESEIGASWVQTPIDAYLWTQMSEAGVKPAGDASRIALVRRLYFDLIGLPPTPDQINEFLEDESPDAYESLVDSLLASNHFGERWGRHWLDVVRYAESSGGGRTLLFPQAWRFRDYVINAFNNNLPYDEFLRQQLAGDLIPSDDWRKKAEMMVATSFLLLGPTNYELQDKDILEMDIIDEQLDTLGKAFMGMTLGCARCHDHKFDPIPTRDYYALAGIFKNTKSVIHSNVSTWNMRKLPVDEETSRKAGSMQTKLKSLEADLKKAKADLAVAQQANKLNIDGAIIVDNKHAQLKGSWSGSTSIKGFIGQDYAYAANSANGKNSASFRPDIPAPGKYQILFNNTPSGNRASKAEVHVHHANGTKVLTVNQQSPGSISTNAHELGEFECTPETPCQVDLISNGKSEGVIIADAAIYKLIPDEFNAIKITSQEEDDQNNKIKIRNLVEEVAELEASVQKVKKSIPSTPSAMAVEDHKKVEDIHVAIRGVTSNKGPKVPRGFMQVIHTVQQPAIPEDRSGRLELAEWITDSNHPLTSRVMVNRIWGWLYGKAIVRSVDNFGATGNQPSHPELLDYLASRFVESGWSVKAIIKEMVSSRSYRLSTGMDSSNMALDPDNKLFWRMERKRLDAESIRDTLLVVAGNLDLESGGSNIKPGTKSEYDYEFDSPRRSVYLPVFRNTLPEIFETFDFADPNMQKGKRMASAVAPQALLLMNSPFVMNQSRLAAENFLSRFDEESPLDNMIDQAFLTTIGRHVTPQELNHVAKFLTQSRNAGGASTRVELWTQVFQTLIQTVDFRYLN